MSTPYSSLRVGKVGIRKSINGMHCISWNKHRNENVASFHLKKKKKKSNSYLFVFVFACQRLMSAERCTWGFVLSESKCQPCQCQEFSSQSETLFPSFWGFYQIWNEWKPLLVEQQAIKLFCGQRMLGRLGYGYFEKYLRTSQGSSVYQSLKRLA